MTRTRRALRRAPRFLTAAVDVISLTCLFSSPLSPPPSPPVMRKRARQDKVRGWEQEEGERRRSGSFQDGRRGSASRYRESSGEESPPPSMSERTTTHTPL